MTTLFMDPELIKVQSKERHIHFGIIHEEWSEDPKNIYLPENFLMHGDSFLIWGEEHDDNTLHVIFPYNGDYDFTYLRRRIPELREILIGCLWSGMRLADYVVDTDGVDWSESQYIWLLDGTLTIY